MRVGIVDVGRAEPTPTKSCLPSGEKTRSRVQWPPPPGSVAICCGLPVSFQVAIVIRKAQHGVRVANVDVLRVRPRRIERDAVGLLQASGEDRDLLRLTVGGDAAKNLDVAIMTLSDEEVAVRRGENHAWLLHVGRVELDLEAGGRLRPRILRAVHDVRAVGRGLGGVRCRQIAGRDLVHRAGLFRSGSR